MRSWYDEQCQVHGWLRAIEPQENYYLQNKKLQDRGKGILFLSKLCVFMTPSKRIELGPIRCYFIVKRSNNAFMIDVVAVNNTTQQDAAEETEKENTSFTMNTDEDEDEDCDIYDLRNVASGIIFWLNHPPTNNIWMIFLDFLFYRPKFWRGQTNLGKKNE